jgi:hypothetical protein
MRQRELPTFCSISDSSEYLANKVRKSSSGATLLIEPQGSLAAGVFPGNTARNADHYPNFFALGNSPL